MVTQKVHTALTAALPYLSSAILTLFTIIGFFLLQEFGRFSELQETVTSIEGQCNVIQSNRFTASDGLEVWKEIQSIHVKIAEVQMSIPVRTPPEWFEKRVEDLSKDVSQNSTQLHAVLAQVNRNAVLLDNLSTKLEK